MGSLLRNLITLNSIGFKFMCLLYRLNSIWNRSSMTLAKRYMTSHVTFSLVLSYPLNSSEALREFPFHPEIAEYSTSLLGYVYRHRTLLRRVTLDSMLATWTTDLGVLTLSILPRELGKWQIGSCRVLSDIDLRQLCLPCTKVWSILLLLQPSMEPFEDCWWTKLW